jgi:hypothetical protein
MLRKTRAIGALGTASRVVVGLGLLTLGFADGAPGA